MKTLSEQDNETKPRSIAKSDTQRQREHELTAQYLDDRPETIVQRKLQESANSSQRTIHSEVSKPRTVLPKESASSQVVQRAWISASDGSHHWDPYIDGVEWIVLPNGEYYYEVRTPEADELYGSTSGVDFAKQRHEWVADRIGKVPDQEVDPHVDAPSVIVAGAQELRRDNGGAIAGLRETMLQWKESTADGQYHSLIDGILEYATVVEDQSALTGWKAKIHLGVVRHSGQIYIAFKYIVENDHLVLDKIVKDPNSREVATKDENEGLNRSAHGFLSSEGRTELDADNEGLVETYYKYGYRLTENYFEIEKPDSIDQGRWDKHQPNQEERGKLRLALTQAGRPPGQMWRMVRAM